MINACTSRRAPLLSLNIYVSLHQVHSKDLKIGLYLGAGNETCNGYPGSLGHYQKDTQLLASWGVDMITLSGCGVQDSGTLDSGQWIPVDFIELTSHEFCFSQMNQSFILRQLLDWLVSVIFISVFPDFERQMNKTGRPMLLSCEWPNILRDKGRQVIISQKQFQSEVIKIWNFPPISPLTLTKSDKPSIISKKYLSSFL